MYSTVGHVYIGTKAGGESFEFSQSLPNCVLCCLNDNVFFCSACLSFCTHSAACEREKWRYDYRKQL